MRCGGWLERLPTSIRTGHATGTRRSLPSPSLAEDRAEQLKRDPDKVVHELDLRLRKDLERKGDFNRIHPMPQSGQDVPDDLDARLVVLGVDHA